MLDIGFSEILVVLVVAFIVFGPEKLPEVAHKMGKVMRQFRRGFQDLMNEEKDSDKETLNK
jgi:Tat protein translocase TatB subunit